MWLLEKLDSVILTLTLPLWDKRLSHGWWPRVPNVGWLVLLKLITLCLSMTSGPAKLGAFWLPNTFSLSHLQVFTHNVLLTGPLPLSSTRRMPTCSLRTSSGRCSLHSSPACILATAFNTQCKVPQKCVKYCMVLMPSTEPGFCEPPDTYYLGKKVSHCF